MFKSFLALCCFSFTLYSHSLVLDGATMEKERTIKGVQLLSGKRDDLRTYYGHVNKQIPADLESVYQNIINFDQKCNNEFKNKRRLMDKKLDCPYRNPNLVESIIIREFKLPIQKESSEIDRFVVKRLAYNRDFFHHYDLIKVYKTVEDGQNTIQIKHIMMTDAEARELLKSSEKTESVFTNAVGTFSLKESKDKKSTQVDYTYTCKTDHWIVNKEVAIAQVYNSIAESLTLLFDSIETGAVKL